MQDPERQEHGCARYYSLVDNRQKFYLSRIECTNGLRPVHIAQLCFIHTQIRMSKVLSTLVPEYESRTTRQQTNSANSSSCGVSAFRYYVGTRATTVVQRGRTRLLPYSERPLSPGPIQRTRTSYWTYHTPTGKEGDLCQTRGAGDTMNCVHHRRIRTDFCLSRYRACHATNVTPSGPHW